MKFKYWDHQTVPNPGDNFGNTEGEMGLMEPGFWKARQRMQHRGDDSNESAG